ncbi:uncharacterized protein B0P05DRAFT_542577 [Gilbertella persicaria]|uniref:uncharacterized protein n=1 Tax=Gilbertella persicaria TaxID=101096 RepID=UPI00221E4D81|nr:uncharacterized protein B0P05DRAFT_542577 [Gilbertella persicaria]KAI8078119.1 hypothetical protein B0P05DRAFT_542577 [Gilbertella persicaria]
MKESSSPARPSLEHASSSTTPTRSTIRSKSKEEIEKLAKQSLDSSHLKRKYTPSPLFSPPRFSRTDTFESDYDRDNPNRWTKRQWKKLEEYYLLKNRDYEKAANTFYFRESLITMNLPSSQDIAGKPKCKELWTKEQILWRAKCLHTSVQYHNGLLPSERKKQKTR